MIYFSKLLRLSNENNFYWYLPWRELKMKSFRQKSMTKSTIGAYLKKKIRVEYSSMNGYSSFKPKKNLDISVIPKPL